MIKAVIFDVDGTLIDSVDAHASSWAEALAQAGFSQAYADVRHQIGKGGDQLLKTFLSDEDIRQHGQQLTETVKKLFAEKYMPGIQAFPAVRELFQRILADGKVALLASSAGEHQLTEFKKLAGIADLIEGETSKDDAERSKPHPDIFAASLGKLPGLSPHEAVVVGDSPWDAIAGKKIDLQTIGVLCGGFPEQELREAGCSEIYLSPADLLSRYDHSLLSHK